MASLPFYQIDVFTDQPFRGNPVAVILDADGLSEAHMQRIANWTNLSETTFVCRPEHAEADYRLRIFTPQSELPFAGHPTLGSAYALELSGRQPRQLGQWVQECGKRLVTIRSRPGGIFLALPEPALVDPEAALLKRVAHALGVDRTDVGAAAQVDVGAVWLTVQLSTAAQVKALQPDFGKLAELSEGITGVTVFGLQAPGAESDMEVRSFAPAHGIPEDPVCGSGNGCVAALVRRDKLWAEPRYIASQGRALGRDGKVQVEFEAGPAPMIWLGGQTLACVLGRIEV